jgi:hypothetical protein
MVARRQDGLRHYGTEWDIGTDRVRYMINRDLCDEMDRHSMG